MTSWMSSNNRENLGKRENQRMSMRIDLEVLNSFDFIMMTTNTRECMSMSMSVMSERQSNQSPGLDSLSTSLDQRKRQRSPAMRAALSGARKKIQMSLHWWQSLSSKSRKAESTAGPKVLRGQQMVRGAEKTTDGSVPCWVDRATGDWDQHTVSAED